MSIEGINIFAATLSNMIQLQQIAIAKSSLQIEIRRGIRPNSLIEFDLGSV